MSVTFTCKIKESVLNVKDDLVKNLINERNAFLTLPGEVIVAGRLDHTKTSSYSMKIRAIDSLTGSWSDTTCDVTILDVNNHYPIFEKTYYVVDVKENVATGALKTPLCRYVGHLHSLVYASKSFITSVMYDKPALLKL